MPEKDFTVTFNEDGDRLLIRFGTDAGRVTWFVVRYETRIDGRPKEVARYDSAHERPHLDLLHWDGTNYRKIWLAEGTDFGEGLTIGIEDLTENWERYRTAFLRRRP